MSIWDWILVAFSIPLGVVTAGHALLYKRDSRAALGWIAFCLMVPVLGPFGYFLFGINRIRTRATKLQRNTTGSRGAEPHSSSPGDPFFRWPRVSGNLIEPLSNGEEAYPSMLQAIARARERLFLATYIMETNRIGRQFVEQLAAAARRGVQVRVLLDGIGELYSFPRAGRLLQKNGVRVARFLPPRLLPPTFQINLRNHRKLLVQDGQTAFVGGMNIGDRHMAEDLENANRVVDIHFLLRGPVVCQIEAVFRQDWNFATGEDLPQCDGSSPRPGNADCRTLVDGPDEDLGRLITVLLNAVSMARERVWIMTPYFLPPREILAALQAAALRGVDVAVLLPEKNNLPFVHWATRKVLWELLERGVQVYYQPGPFVHSKLFLVDDYYVQLGSANIDPRSLRLNFELAVEVYDQAFARDIAARFTEARARSHATRIEEVDRRPLPVRTRDALAWLFSPYL